MNVEGPQLHDATVHRRGTASWNTFMKAAPYMNPLKVNEGVTMTVIGIDVHQPATE